MRICPQHCTGWCSLGNQRPPSATTGCGSRWVSSSTTPRRARCVTPTSFTSSLPSCVWGSLGTTPWKWWRGGRSTRKKLWTRKIRLPNFKWPSSTSWLLFCVWGLLGTTPWKWWRGGRSTRKKLWTRKIRLPNFKWPSSTSWLLFCVWGLLGTTPWKWWRGGRSTRERYWTRRIRLPNFEWHLMDKKKNIIKFWATFDG